MNRNNKYKSNIWINKKYKYTRTKQLLDKPPPLDKPSPLDKPPLDKPPLDKPPLLQREPIKLNQPKMHILNPNAMQFMPNMIQVDILKDDNTNNIENIFKALFNLDNTLNIENKNKLETKLKIKEFDLTKEYVELNKEIKTIDDLISLIDLYPLTDNELMSKYTIDLQKIINMKDTLIELKNMIGMSSVKQSIIKQIMYFLQGIEEQQDMLHMVITGSPGTGKTTLGIILARLYYQMGIIETKPSINPLTGQKEKFNFKIYKRSDLIAQYLGHTAIKTQKAIDECSGGVMFLDEAYSLGHDEKSDIYTKECLDTINQNLSENKNKFILIIAGYPEQLDKCFFSHNEGLRRRFSFKYNIEKYTSDELLHILRHKITSNKWILENTINNSDIIKLIETNMEQFENFGGDIESWLLHIKIEHGVRIFGKHPKYRKIINIDDLKIGLETFKKAKINKYDSNRISKDIIQYMYT